jgi:hypothetical protein
MLKHVENILKTYLLKYVDIFSMLKHVEYYLDFYARVKEEFC